MNFNSFLNNRVIENQSKFFIVLDCTQILKNVGIFVKAFISFYHYRSRIVFYLFLYRFKFPYQNLQLKCQ